MPARSRLLFALCAMTLATLPASYADTDSGSTGSKPNIILILTDDLGYGDIGANGADMIATPNIDRLAQEGVRLTSYYAPANVCTPSRAGMLTGRQPIRMGLAAGVLFPQSKNGLPQEELTLPEMLASAGYRTAMVGKWHLGNTPEHWPTAHGFERFFGAPYSNDMSPFPLYEGDRVIEPEADQSRLTERYTDTAIEIIEAAGDQPFFLYLAHTFPHIPLFAAPPFRGQSEAGLYGDTVETIDWSTGRILQALRENGLDDNTLVIFTSDNGPWFEGSAGVSRDRKGGTWDGAYRVPFVARWPAGLPAGTVSPAAVTGLDLFPTLARLTGATLPGSLELDGADILDVLAEGAPGPHQEILFFNEDQIAGIRMGKWKLMVRSYYKQYDVPLADRGYPLLFDLERDPGERYSLAPEHPQQVAAMLQAIEAARLRLAVPEAPVFAPGGGD